MLLDRAFSTALRATVLAAALVVAAPAGRAYAQSDQDKAAARQLATQGTQALAQNRYAEALDLVTRAEAILHAPTHLHLIARAQIALGKYVAAQETLLKLTREELSASAPAAFRNAQDEGRRELAEVETKIANLRIVLQGAEGKKVSVKIDDQPVADALLGVYRPTDPGKHEIVATPASGPVARASITLSPGDKKDVTLAIVDDGSGAVVQTPVDGGPAPGFFTGMRIAGFGAAGVGAGGIVLGVVMLGARSTAEAQGLAAFNACNPGCTKAQRNSNGDIDARAANDGTIAVIAFAGGGAAIIAGVTLIVLGKPKAAPPPATGFVIKPFFTGTSAGLAGSF